MMLTRIFFSTFAFMIMLSCAPPEDYEPTRHADAPCNGFIHLCDSPLPKVFFAGTHNSFAVRGSLNYGFYNQTKSITHQLNMGIRALMLDTYLHKPIFSSEKPSLCHSNCTFGGFVDLKKALGEILVFLKSNPNEVILLLIEPHSLSPERFKDSLVQSGIFPLVYAHPTSQTNWPTLGNLIGANKRVVIFYENDGRPPAPQHSFYHPMWEYFGETTYHFRKVSQFNCQKNRGTQLAPFYLINHFISNPLPSRRASNKANSWNILKSRVQKCLPGHAAAIIAVDFFQLATEPGPNSKLSTVVDLATELNSIHLLENQ